MVSLSAHAVDMKTAIAVVKKYSEAIACQIAEPADDKNQYKAVKIDSGLPDMDGLGAKFVVYWRGDVGCAGGNGTSLPNFTVVEQAGFVSADPVVMPDYRFPALDIVDLTSMTAGKNGVLILTGKTYGPGDKQHSPTKVVKYSLKLVNDKFVAQ